MTSASSTTSSRRNSESAASWRWRASRCWGSSRSTGPTQTGRAIGCPPDWGVIATFVDPHAHKRGAGRALFANTVEAAKNAGVSFIDATIRKENTGGQAYYGGIGFTDYSESAETVSKRFAPQ